MIKICNLEKIYGKSIKALTDVNMEIKKGEIFGLLGPNGAGKSTLIKILTTIEKPSNGKCIVNGFDVEKEPLKARMQFGVVPQDLTVDNKLTAWDNLYLTARYYHIRKCEINSKIENALKIVRLWEDKDRLVEEFSGGMKKRLDIATALLHNPQIIFLDEPTVGLDVQSRKEIWGYVNYLVSENKVTVFLTTHYMEEADNLCDRIAIFNKGEVKMLDTPYNLKRKLEGDLITIKFKDNAYGNDINEILKTEKYVLSAKKYKDEYVILVNNSEECMPKIFQCLKLNGIEIELISSKKSTLDDVFLEATGDFLGKDDNISSIKKHWGR